MIGRILNFIRSGVWEVDVKEYRPILGFLLRQLRIVLLAIKEFKENQIQLRASALTYYSLLSVVPIAAMAFGIAKGFGFETRLEREIRNRVAENEEMADVVEYILEFANSMLQNINGGVIAGIGVVLLFWSVMKVLGNIENSFNVIWQIRKSRPFARKFADYLSMMLVSPILFFLSTTLTGFISSLASKDIAILSALGPILLFLVKLVPYFLIFLLFTMLYVVMPNTRFASRMVLLRVSSQGSFSR
jgi:membrane protein